MSTRFTIVGNYISPYVRKVLVCLEAKGIGYDIDPITPFIGDDRFSALNPLRRIPVLIEGDIAFIKTNEPVLAFRRFNAEDSLVCVYNLSPEPVKVTVRGEAQMRFWQHAERNNDKLVLGPNGFAFLKEAETPLTVDFKGRLKRRPSL